MSLTDFSADHDSSSGLELAPVTAAPQIGELLPLVLARYGIESELGGCGELGCSEPVPCLSQPS